MDRTVNHCIEVFEGAIAWLPHSLYRHELFVVAH